MSNLLLEIGTEEIPAGYIAPALRQMEELFIGQVKKNRISFKDLHTTGTPRRLVLFADGLPQKQENVVEEIKGPSAKVAFDKSGLPTKAAIGFANSQGVKAEDLKVKDTPKGKYCFAIKEIEGKKVFDLLPGILAHIITSIVFPKSMRWKTEKLYFARPIRSILALFDKDVINLESNGIKADRKTNGHPFLSDKVKNVEFADYDVYKEMLRSLNVIVEIEERRNIISEAINSILSDYRTKLEDEELLDEVTNLVEYPGAVKCSFDREYLKIPGEIIETAMKDHQRYFPVKDKDGSLLPEFIVINDRGCNDSEIIRKGNERVLRARLADAKFFWDEDRKISLHERVNGLEGLVFHEDIGSYLNREERIGILAQFISEMLNFSPKRLKLVKRASLLCKADLLTEMVGEFPKLQGIIGREYALAEGENEEVANSIAEHYLPRYATDGLPKTEAGTVLSLADKFDIIASCFSAGLIPTGSQDPYALRRQAQGIIRILETRDFGVSFSKVFKMALSNLTDICASDDKDMIYEKIKDFFKDRLNNYYLEKNYRYDIIESVMRSGFDNISDFFYRLKIVTKISKTHIWHSLVTVVERTFNIGKNCTIHGEVNEDLLKEEEEHKLWNVYKSEKGKILAHVLPKRYEELSVLYNDVFAEPVHDFFDKVFVNVEDENIRNNRLLLVKKINELYTGNIANLAFIVEHER
ncbi:MAG: glycine--tRNA ligase subunit beta [Candidatus Scalinduaceae bacterium]